MKKFLAITAVLVTLALIVTACGGGGGNSIVGKWEINMNVAEGVSASLVIEFKSDNTYVTTGSSNGISEQVGSGKYEIKDGKISMDGSEFVPYTINGNKLTFSQDGISLELTRK
ncbi:MAG: hypothetical protein IKS31_08055 [Clostridia bacterium]|nr:hypothetical protein [Clostridia bacterium]MBR4458896.1 hypothetical protein [Clostridia bacterium]